MRSTDRFLDRFRALAIALLAGAVLAGCASKHLEVSVDRDTLVERSPLECRVTVAEFVDSVGPRTHVGAGANTFAVSGIADTIDAQLDQWQPDLPSDRRSISLSLELARAYSTQKTTQVIFHTALVVRAADEDARIFRGVADMTTWFGSESEYRHALHESLNDALGKLHGWLSDRCTASS